MGAERRQFDRTPLRMLVQYRLRDLDEFMKLWAVNLSAGGMFIRTEEPHPKGAKIYLQFRVDGGESLFEGLGEVVHVNPPEDENPGMGVEFINLDAPSKALIDQIVKGRAEPESSGDAS